MKIYIFLIFTYLQLFSAENFSQKVLKDAKEKYGEQVVSKMTYWNEMIEKAKVADTLNKLKLVNDFFNNVPYVTDIKHWEQDDYWASPMEFVGTTGGDCEDYAIAKYFTLIKVGIDESKLRLGYVKYLKKGTDFEETHMVLLYFHRENAIPIVLDNILKKMELASERDDLKLVYSFNAQGLWEAKNKGKEHVKVGENKLLKWKSLIEKI